MQAYLFQNAQVCTSDAIFRGSVLTNGEKVIGIFRDGEALPCLDGVTVISAEGKYLLPGGVDAHTHFDLDVGTTRASDDFYTGSIAAACGGTTTIIDHMAFGPKGCPLTHQPKVYHQLAQKTVIDYGFHGVIQHVDGTVLRDMEVLRDTEGITSLKVYLTYDDKLDDAAIFQVLRRAKQLGLVICAHCENDALVTTLREEYASSGRTQPRYHAKSRPPQAEAEAIYRMLMLASAASDAKVYIVHLSTQMGLAAIRLARKNGQKNIYAETCPQYLFLDDSLYGDDNEGLKYIMSPPLRKQSDISALWQALAHDELDTLGTDHCPFFFATQKQRGANNFTLCPNGAPGAELRLPLLFSEGFLKKRITMQQLVRLCCTNPAHIFGISSSKGDIKTGGDADLVLFDPSATWTVRQTTLHENVDYTPYEGMQLMGKPVLTLSRGEIIVKDGQFCGIPGRGKYLKRSYTV